MKMEDVTVCDECKKVLSESKCFLCNKDLCQACRQFATMKRESSSIINIFSSSYKSTDWLQLPMCESCIQAIRTDGSQIIQDNDKDGKTIYVDNKEEYEFLKKIIKMMYDFSVAKKV